MQQAILITHVVVGMLFVLTVLLQDKGTGLSATFGGSGSFYASQRGAAKVMHYISIVLCVMFFATALIFVVLPADVAPAALEPTSGSPAPVTVDADSVKLE